MSCIFCDIVNKKVPAKIVYEDDQVIVFHDIKPEAKLHLLAVPKKHIPSLREADAKTLIHLFKIANQVIKGDYNIKINVGPSAGQEVHHLHIHLLQNK
jgi:histidine triad (HIT) family protein